MAASIIMRRIFLQLVGTMILSSVGIVLLSLAVGHGLNEDDIVYAAYLNTDAHIYQMSPIRHISREITHNRAQDTSPIWSPDGKQIAFVSKVGGLNLVSVMNAYNGHPLPVTDGVADEYSPAWSPDGRYIAFLRLKGITTDIFLTDLQAHTTRRLTTATHNYYPPAWSPDGRYLTFAADITAKDATDLFKLDVQTDIISPLLVDTPAQETYNAWSPDGRYLLYIAKDVSDNIYVQDMQSGQSTLVYKSEYLTSVPNWSSDNRSMIFSAFAENRQDGLFRLDIPSCVQKTGGCVPELLGTTYGMFLHPRWRPRSS